MKKIKILSIIVLCVMLFGSAVITAVLPKKAYSDLENRNLEQKPQLTKEQFLQGKYQEKYEAYLSDQFFLRDRWVDLAVTLQKQMGKRDINNVYLGKEGYLLEKDYFVVAENALKIKKYLDRGLRKAKTDKKDSLKLAEYACDNWYKLNKVRENDEIYDNLKFLSRRYLDNISIQTKEKINFSNLCDLLFPGFYQLLNGFYLDIKLFG